MNEYIHFPFVTLLLIATIWSTVFSLTSNPAIRGYRNLGILAPYILVVVFLFVAGLLSALATWAMFGLAGGLIYTLWEIVQRMRTPPGEDKSPVNISNLAYGLLAWPIMVPEAIEYALADLGFLSSPPNVWGEEEDESESEVDGDTPIEDRASEGK